MIGLFKIEKENYETVNKCLKEIFYQIENLDSILIEDKYTVIEKYFTSDLKILSIVCGITAANSNYPCCWCTIKLPSGAKNLNQQDQANFEDELSKEWSISDKQKGCRTYEESNRLRLQTKAEERRGKF